MRHLPIFFKSRTIFFMKFTKNLKIVHTLKVWHLKKGFKIFNFHPLVPPLLKMKKKMFEGAHHHWASYLLHFFFQNNNNYVYKTRRKS